MIKPAIFFILLISLQISLPFTCATLAARDLDQSYDINLGISEYPPYEFKDPITKKLIGSDVEIVTQVLTRLGYRVKITIAPWKRVVYQVEEKELNGLFSFTNNPKREKLYWLTDPVSQAKDVFFKRSNDSINWDGNPNFSGLEKYIVGISGGYVYDRKFMEAIKNKRFKNVASVTSKTPEIQNLRKLRSKRIDLFICEINACGFYIKKHLAEFKNIDYIDKPIMKVRPFHAGLSRKWKHAKEIRQKFNTELKKFIKEGKRAEIFQKYGMPDID